MARPGSSSQAAIAVSDDENEQNSSNENAEGSSSKSRRPASGASKQQPRKGNFTSKHARRDTSKKKQSAVATAERSSSNSSSSDGAIFVASSRTTSVKHAAGTATKGKTTSTNGTGNGSQSSQDTSQNKRRKTDKQQVTTIDEDDEDATVDDEEEVHEARPSFQERLSQNIKNSPRFSKAFRGKVKGSASTSMPLDDERFDSGGSDNGYESPDRPSPRKQKQPRPLTSKQPVKSKKRKAQSPVVVDSDEPVSKGKKRSSTTVRISDDSDEGEGVGATNTKGKGKGRATVIEDNENESSDLPDIPQAVGDTSSRSAYKNNLENLSSSRKERQVKEAKKEKRKKRVVASPELSPRPFSKAQPLEREAEEKVDDDEVPEPRSKPAVAKTRRKRGEPDPPSSSPRSTAGTKKSQPLFIDSEDEVEQSDQGTQPARKASLQKRRRRTSSSAISVRASPSKQARTNGKKGKVKKLSRPAPPSSTSSSSGSGDSDNSDVVGNEDTDDEVDGPENLKMDYDHVQQEKLRPKNDAKERRLDAYQAARLAKQQKAERLKRGIIDSDDDEQNAQTQGTWKGAKVESSSSSEGEEDGEEESIPDLDDDDEFVVPDDEKAKKEQQKAEQLMPTQYSKHAKKDLQDHFGNFIHLLIFSYIYRNSKRFQPNAEMKFSRLAIEKEITGIINSGIASSIWREDFRAAIDERPILEMYQIPTSAGCEGCNKYDRMATKQAHVSGKRYDRDTFEEYSDDDDDEEQVFDLGKFCAEKCGMHHDLKHFQYHTKALVDERCGDLYRAPVETGDKEERDRARDKEAARIFGILQSGRVNLVAQKWDELHMLLERAKHKFTK